MLGYAFVLFGFFVSATSYVRGKMYKPSRLRGAGMHQNLALHSLHLLGAIALMGAGEMLCCAGSIRTALICLTVGVLFDVLLREVYIHREVRRLNRAQMDDDYSGLRRRVCRRSALGYCHHPG